MPVKILWRGLLSLLLVCSLLLAACATGPAPSAAITPAKSPNDKHAYRLLTLDNGLQVLLVSDPNTPKAAAALDVEVGSGDNPAGRGGLAHFLEHMLFLGTDKYPDPAEYEEFVTEHGGSRNAYTSFEHTNYFFDINAAYLPQALDRFAQFFIAPRFDAEYVDREKNAVEAEYQMGLKSDPRRGLDVLQEVMNPAHPFSQFAVGSLDSLADRPGASIRDELLAFYHQHYSANAMRLVVLGRESLDELEALVTPMFSPVPNRDYQPPAIDAPLFTAEQLPMLVTVKPQATLRQLDVSFPVADYRSDYEVQPLSYLGNLVGHEGEGSVLSQLKAEGLAESLSAGSGLGWRGGALFSVNVNLTERGVAQYQRVLQILFAYLDMLREQGPQQRLYDEQAQLAALRFRFKEDPEPINYVSSLASGMHYFKPEDVLQGPYLMRDYQPALLGELLASVTPENALVTLTDEGVQTDQVSSHYEVPYARRHVNAAARAGWLSPQAEPNLHLPAPNEFIAEDVELVALQEPVPDVPQRVLEQGRQTLWFLQDAQFRLPKGGIYINFRSPEVGQSARQTAGAVLYTALLRDAVNEFTYPALLAGLNFDLYKHAQGISLRISGYTDKQSLLLARLLDTLQKPQFDAARFANIRADMIRGLQNTVAKRPSNQVIDDLREALLYGEWGEQDLIAALQGMTLADVQAYAEAFWRGASAETLMYGNYLPAQGDTVVAQLAALLPQGPAPALPPLKVLKLAAGEALQLAADVPHDDAVIAWYLQGAGATWPDRAATALTGQIIKSGFFQQLRTEQQLGYVVAALPWAQLDVPGLVLLIQSPSASAPDVAAAMAAFMAAVPEAVTPEQFARHQAALVHEITKPDKNLWERAEFFWQSIAKKQYAFDGRSQLASAVQALDLAGWQAYYQREFQHHNRSLQAVAPGRWGKLPAGADRVFQHPAAIKDGHAAYVIE
ncbi:insulinase family protein [Parahaliea mediterranea]|uniref:insulinase family protein n=1 Tax=Parahaliea mediterranea TaxID=651086 RepID=UPI000E2FD4C7|nr:insulinase family protein [Parahaliea mediterranea]